MPQCGRDVVFQAGDPLRSVLRRPCGLDHPLVIVTHRSSQGQRLAGLLGLACRLFSPGRLACPLALVERVAATPHQFACIVARE